MNEELKIIISAQTAEAEKNINNAKKAVGNLGEEGAKSSSKFSGAMKALGNVSKVALKATATALAAVSSGVVALTGAAVKNYAEYEQLVGGVETLFGSSAKLVQGYADEAYQTAGLSANAYMETVTGFSASLLQSLDGDTKAAATSANQAVIDMSDNANKMGTSMESIQNAYQGFAKQNYTMLDNLKLGYGGTKEEMQRLIDDANKVKSANGEMADLSINSFADVTEAIHLIQNEMGITGTTAKEASTTISGSVNMVKASWSNLLTGLADDNADFDTLINNFVDSVSVAGENILPRVEIALEGVAMLIDSLFPVIVRKIPSIILNILPKILETATNIITTLVNGIVTAFPTVVETLSTLLPEIVNTIVLIIPQITEAILGALPTLITTVTEIVTAVINGLAEILPQILEQIVAILPQIAEALINGIPSLLAAAISLFTAIVDAIPKILPPLISALPQIIKAITDMIIKNLPTILKQGIELFKQIVQAIPQFLPLLVAALPQIITAILKAVIQAIPTLLSTGIQLFMALVKAIPQIIGALIIALGQVISTINTHLREKISEVFEKIKTNMSEKIQAAKTAVVDKFTQIKTSVTEKIQAAKDKVTEIFSKVKDAITKPVEKARDTVKGLIDKIKGFFNFSWSLPKLKMPHFSVSGKFSLNPPSIPKFNVSWYKLGGVFDKTTLFPYGNGSIGGLGEDGAEAVVPLEKNTKWLDIIADKITGRQGGNRPIVLQVDGKTFAEISVESINDLTRLRGSLPLKLV